MRKQVTLLALMLLCTLSTFAYDFEVEGIYYNILNDTSVAVTHRGEGDTYIASYSGDVVIPQSVTYNEATYNVTNIGTSAFCNCEELTQLTIPEGVTTIGYMAFYNCRNLTSMTFPNSITQTNTAVFTNCSSLTHHVYNDKVFAYLLPTYEGEYTIPYGIEKICCAAIQFCPKLTKIIIPNTVTSIEDWNIYACESLISITIPNSVTHIGSMYTFTNCSALESIEVEEGNSVYHSAGNCLIETEAKKLIVGCQNSIIPNDGSVTEIGFAAFMFSSNLTSIIIPESVTQIEPYAFPSCYNLQSVIWNAKDCKGYDEYYPGFIDSTRSYPLFDDGCTKLSTITFGDSVKTIPANLCRGIRKLTSVVLTSTTPPTLGDSCFADIPANTVFTVPCGYVDTYKAADGWKDLPYTFVGAFDYTLTANSANEEHGTVTITQAPSCESEGVAIIEATPAEGYEFTQWSDGNTENPRTIEVTQDTTFTALFAPAITDLSLRTHSIMLYPKDSYYMNAIVVPEDADKRSLVWSSSNEAIVSVEGCIATAHQIGKAIVKVTTADGLLSDSCEVVVSEEGHEAKDDVVVDPDNESVDITWTPVEGAAYYVFVVYADEAQVTKICTLTFNAWGFLTNIHFQRNKPAANREDTPFNFTVTGLEENTTYSYSMSSYDENETIITSKAGQFTTTSNATTGIETLSHSVSNEVTKVLENGTIYILRNGSRYTIDGRKLE